MPPCTAVAIDLARVLENLRTPDGGGVGEGTARSFLRQVGFEPSAGEDGAWVGPRSGLGRLNHSEVLAVWPLGR